MAEVTPLKLVPTTAGQGKFARFGPGDVQSILHGGTGAGDAVNALANLGGAKASDLAAHLGATNPHGLTLAALGAVAQAVYDLHANNTAIHRQINDNGETLLDLWSALQIKNHVQAQIDALVGSSPGALDTINELAAALGNDPNAIATLTAEIGLKIPKTDRGADEGVCELVGGKVPLSRMPFAEPVFGKEFHYAVDLEVDTTSFDNWQLKLTTTTHDLPAGIYLILLGYGWNHNNSRSDFRGRLVINGNQQGQEHFQEPQDTGGNWENTGTNQRQYAMRPFIAPLAGVQEYRVEYCSSDSGEESSIWDTLLGQWRVA